MLVRAESGDKDYLRDVLNLYVDLVQMFVRVKKIGIVFKP